MTQIRIWNDKWEENGKTYTVLSHYKPGDSTGIHFELQKEDGTIDKRVIPSHDIEWIED